ncbi:23S rRNA (guanosine(2251)-2'-O)-methyltransferase RlmB [Candidatus Albibeggiatoa sp. nov. NOAA]|uniref:23S rRNA (guanosine(2251)-2'-O)-methyltransferase RlmB n=1 Tax=Candidatus Albibeggiatoa sp. nov. NOAA TaxID=3162724 RepID=UPI0033004593|nr:23S rRNA (guanosine(2251)-2'-O)-methyltransferase RlmB [Thiotrichaceae bacterium]
MSKPETIFGIHAVQQVLESDPMRILEIWVLEGRHDKRLQTVLEALTPLGLTINQVQRKTLDKLSQQGQHQGIVVRCKAQPVLNENDLQKIVERLDKPAFFLILDEVQDPHNLGACFRTADATGVDAIIVPKNKACGLSPTVHKVACGAATTIPFIQVTNLARTLQWLQKQNIWVIGTSDHAQKWIYDVDFTANIAMVMGAEGTGLRRLTEEHCDELVKLPMLGSVESLNVSVATGVCLYEVVKQRLNQ